MDRSLAIDTIKNEKSSYDFIIIGGGATGIGILLEALTRGYSAVLLEANDFTKSTSSKSTKLVHGGVRYLAQGNIGLVREACIERGYLTRNAPHIVKNRPFIIPVYNLFDEFLYLTGLKLYDLLAWPHNLGRSRRISRKEVLSFVPGLKSNALKAGILYHDGQFDDSRLALATLQTAAEKGGVAINYMRVNGLQKNKKGLIEGVHVHDELELKDYDVQGKVIVNATGVFADEIMEMDVPGNRRTIRPSQGIHLVLDKKFLAGDQALMIPKTEDGRVIFAIPWLGKVVVGTTDTPVEETSAEPLALQDEIEFILRTMAKYFNHAPEKEDVNSVFTGLRPLAASGNNEKTKEISRGHKIINSKSGLLTIIGGKWTTYRKMAEDLVSKAERLNSWEATKTQTPGLKLYGYSGEIKTDISLQLYGSEADKIRQIQQEAGHRAMLSEKLNISVAQVIYSIRYEMAMKVEDILARRTRALLLDAREAINLARPVAEIMAKEIGHDRDWIEKEVREFRILAEKYIIDY